MLCIIFCYTKLAEDSSILSIIAYYSILACYTVLLPATAHSLTTAPNSVYCDLNTTLATHNYIVFIIKGLL